MSQGYDPPLQTKVASVTKVAGLCFGNPLVLSALGPRLSQSEIVGRTIG